MLRSQFLDTEANCPCLHKGLNSRLFFGWITKVRREVKHMLPIPGQIAILILKLFAVKPHSMGSTCKGYSIQLTMVPWPFLAYFELCKDSMETFPAAQKAYEICSRSVCGISTTLVGLTLSSLQVNSPI